MTSHIPIVSISKSSVLNEETILLNDETPSLFRETTLMIYLYILIILRMHLHLSVYAL